MSDKNKKITAFILALVLLTGGAFLIFNFSGTRDAKSNGGNTRTGDAGQSKTPAADAADIQSGSIPDIASSGSDLNPVPKPAPIPTTEPTPEPTTEPTPAPTAELTPEPTTELIYATISTVGDIMCHKRQLNDAYDAASGTYDFNHCFDHVRELFKSADFLLTNFEGSLSTRGEFTGYPTFITPAVLMDAVKKSGIDLVAMAGNHCMDNGIEGLRRSIECLDSYGVEHIGTYKSGEERAASSGTKIFDIKGIKVGFINYTYGTNWIWVPKGCEYAVNLLYEDYVSDWGVVINEKAILQDLDYLKSAGVDLICAQIHMGTEYQTTANTAQENVAEFLIKNGVDIMFGNHAHVIQPMGMRTILTADGEEKNVFVCYSLGNLLANNVYDQYTVTSVMAEVYVKKDKSSGKTTVEGYGYRPLYVTAKAFGGARYRSLDVHKAIEEYEAGESDAVSAEIYGHLNEALKICHEILGKEHDVYLTKK